MELSRRRRVAADDTTQRGHRPCSISILITFLVVILILYLINLLPIDGRAKQIVQIIVIVIGVLSLLEIHRGLLTPEHGAASAR